jgi:hypothetical protein
MTVDIDLPARIVEVGAVDAERDDEVVVFVLVVTSRGLGIAESTETAAGRGAGIELG